MKATYQQRWGIYNGNSKLTPKLVAEIRHSDETSRTLARRYRVSQTCIIKIKRGLTWPPST
jgi:hypothetical protein